MTYHEGIRPAQETDDPEDAALLSALAAMQEIVTGHLLSTGLSIDDYDEAGQRTLVDRLRAYLGFELGQSDGIWVGMPFRAEGDGGILVADREGAIVGAQHMAGADAVEGIVDGVLALPVPAIECMRAAAGEQGHSVPGYTQSFSAVVVLQGAKFHTQETDDGAPSTVVHDLSGYRVIVPAVYGMQMSVPGMYEL